VSRFAIIHKKERWTLTWMGCLVTWILLLSPGLWYVLGIHSFLAVTDPADAEILVVEGFIPDYAVEQAGILFSQGNYSLIVITGNARLKGAHLDVYDNDGEFTAATLEKLGYDRSKILVLATEKEIERDRTYASALLLKKMTDEGVLEENIFNLVTLGCHARRSRLLFQKAMGTDVEMGVIAIRDESYNPDIWWKNSHGFREVIKETIAWVYARFFFCPS
jgi:hypothetical protein